jgi:hypothetical protein
MNPCDQDLPVSLKRPCEACILVCWKATILLLSVQYVPNLITYGMGQHLQWDAVFKLKLLKWKGYKLMYPSSWNQRHIIPNALTDDFLKRDEVRRNLPPSQCHDYVADNIQAGMKKGVRFMCSCLVGISDTSHPCLTCAFLRHVSFCVSGSSHPSPQCHIDLA